MIAQSHCQIQRSFAGEKIIHLKIELTDWRSGSRWGSVLLPLEWNLHGGCQEEVKGVEVHGCDQWVFFPENMVRF